MKKHYLIILFSIVPFLTIYFLHKICYSENTPTYKFERKIVTIPFGNSESINLGSQYIKIIGEINDNLYMYSDDLYKMIKVDFSNKRKKIALKSEYPIQTANIFKDSIFTFSLHPNAYTIYDSQLKMIKKDKINGELDRGVYFKNLFYYRFTNSKSIGQFRTDNFNHETKIMKYNVSDSLIIDGGITTDGYFVNDDESLVYVQYHKGIFYKLDSNNIKRSTMPYVFNTIPGFNIKGSTFSISKPIIAKNKFSCISGNYLYNASFVKNTSQTFKEFTNKIIVDVYTISQGKYIYSFYLPNDDNGKPIDVKINKNSLYVLYGKKISKYKFEK